MCKFLPHSEGLSVTKLTAVGLTAENQVCSLNGQVMLAKNTRAFAMAVALCGLPARGHPQFRR